MKSRIRRLRLRLIRQYAETIAEPVVDDYVWRWEQAACEGREVPPPSDLFHRLLDENLWLPVTSAATDNYLRRCHNQNKTPGYDRLIELLLHWKRPPLLW